MGSSKKWFDPRGGHVRLYIEDLLDSPAWFVLSKSARVLYVELRADLKIKREGIEKFNNNGTISCTIATASKRGSISSETTLASALRELCVLGFIKRVREGYVKAGSKVATLFAFTDEDWPEFTRDGNTFGPGKATFDWCKFLTMADAKEALAKGMAEEEERAKRKQQPTTERSLLTLQKLGAKAPISGERPPFSQKMEPSKRGRKAPISGALMQVGVGAGKPGRKHHDSVEVDGTTYKRLVLSTDCKYCTSNAGQRHRKGCNEEPCPVCPKFWKRCHCGQIGKLRDLNKSERRQKAAA